jgi:AcrR family transcriptional regulator
MRNVLKSSRAKPNRQRAVRKTHRPSKQLQPPKALPRPGKSDARMSFAPQRQPINRRMSKPDDARALRSRDALREALLGLIEKQAFEQISIKDITSTAGVSYPVFFRRYATREELLGDIAAEEVRRLLALTVPVFERESEDSSLRVLCDFVREHRKLWTTLLTTGAKSIMREEFIRIAKGIASTHKHRNPWLPTDLAAAFVVGAIFEILAWWLRQPVSYPIENVVTLLDVLVVRSTARPVDIKLKVPNSHY